MGRSAFLLKLQNATVPHKFNKHRVVIKINYIFQYIINALHKHCFIIPFLAWTSVPGVDARKQSPKATPSFNSQLKKKKKERKKPQDISQKFFVSAPAPRVALTHILHSQSEFPSPNCLFISRNSHKANDEKLTFV